MLNSSVSYKTTFSSSDLGLHKVYSYGFNTQEREDEIAQGIYTAEYWKYDSRIGRRWNLDPKPNVDISPYSTFRNNPTTNTDWGGDTTRYYSNSSGALIGEINDGTFLHSVKVDEATYNDYKSTAGATFDLTTVTGAKEYSEGFEHISKVYDKIFGTSTFEKIGWTQPVYSNIKQSDYVPYTTDCEDAARSTVTNGGGSANWKDGGTHMLVDNTIQGSSPLIEDRAAALKIIDAELTAGKPVLVGVAYYGGSRGDTGDKNTNKLVGHFVVITGKGNNKHGNYYTYFDNAYNGTDIKSNRFYQDNSTGLLKGISNNDFVVVDVRNNIN
jgi:hypothetical protein